MTILVQHLTNRAYGFPARGAKRRVTPVALACIHITGNSQTAAYADRHAAAQGEWKYANRLDSPGPSAHYYVARDGWAIEAISPADHAAWSNGDIKTPNTANAGIVRVLALVARGFNANEAYWVEFEDIGYSSSYPITVAQRQAVAEIIAREARRTGLPVSRETVHGHWEINSVTRWNCPSPSHETFLNDVIDRANALGTSGGVLQPVPAPEEASMGPFPVNPADKLVTVIPGRNLYLLDLSAVRDTASSVVGAESPAGYRTGGVDYRVIKVPFLGVYELVLVKNADCSAIDDPTSTPAPPEPAPAPNCDAAVELATATLQTQLQAASQQALASAKVLREEATRLGG